MWAEAAKWLGKFDEAVLTMLDSDGYPASVRVDSRAYDPATGELPATLPGALHVVEGPANLLCHYHDEKLWKLNAIQHQGSGSRIEMAHGCSPHGVQRAVETGDVVVHQGNAVLGQEIPRQARSRPSEVDWAAVKEIQRRAKQ